MKQSKRKTVPRGGQDELLIFGLRGEASIRSRLEREAKVQVTSLNLGTEAGAVSTAMARTVARITLHK